MDEKKIYDFISRFEDSKLTVMKIESDDLKLHLEKPGPNQVVMAQAPINQTVETVSASSQAQLQAGGVQQTQAVETNSYEKVKSPIVGVFYEAPSPNDEPYAVIGQKVSKGQVLCLVEAMKMMNELKSPVDGIIKNIYGKNGELVEFDQILFEVEQC